MALGDHIYIHCQDYGIGYTHHGIDCGDGTVIEYQKNSGKIVQITIDEFARKTEINVKKYDQCYEASRVVQRAKKRLGENAYNIFGNNCEHFARWCKTGDRLSEQIDYAFYTVRGTTKIGVSTAANTYQAYQIAQTVATQATTKIGAVGTSVVTQVPKAANFFNATTAVAGGLSKGIVGAASGLIADYTLDQILIDNQNLSRSERKARETGRFYGKVGSTVGGIAGCVGSAFAGGLIGGVAIAASVPIILGVGVGLSAYYLTKPQTELSNTVSAE